MSPARMRRIVDFPQPEGPRSATTSDGLMATLMSSSTRSFEPFGITKSCDTPRASQRTSVASAVIVVIAFTSLAEREALFRHAIQPLPHRPFKQPPPAPHDRDPRR